MRVLATVTGRAGLFDSQLDDKEHLLGIELGVNGQRTLFDVLELKYALARKWESQKEKAPELLTYAMATVLKR